MRPLVIGVQEIVETDIAGQYLRVHMVVIQHLDDEVLLDYDVHGLEVADEPEVRECVDIDDDEVVEAVNTTEQNDDADMIDDEVGGVIVHLHDYMIVRSDVMLRIVDEGEVEVQLDTHLIQLDDEMVEVD